MEKYSHFVGSEIYSRKARKEGMKEMVYCVLVSIAMVGLLIFTYLSALPIK